MRRKILGLGIALVALLIVYSNGQTTNQFGYAMYNHYVSLAYAETGATNVVTAIYLNYRYYDTLFEALMLLFSIIAVIYLSVHEGSEHHE